jgi:hypothetical protein
MLNFIKNLFSIKPVVIPEPVVAKVQETPAPEPVVEPVVELVEAPVVVVEEVVETPKPKRQYKKKEAKKKA